MFRRGEERATMWNFRSARLWKSRATLEKQLIILPTIYIPYYLFVYTAAVAAPTISSPLLLLPRYTTITHTHTFITKYRNFITYRVWCIPVKWLIKLSKITWLLLGNKLWHDIEHVSGVIEVYTTLFTVVVYLRTNSVCLFPFGFNTNTITKSKTNVCLEIKLKLYCVTTTSSARSCKKKIKQVTQIFTTVYFPSKIWTSI